MMRIHRWCKKEKITTIEDIPFRIGATIDCDDPMDVWTTIYDAPDTPDAAHQSSLDYLAGV